jgi:hypothetical protein
LQRSGVAAMATDSSADAALRKELVVLQAAARESLRREVKMRAELSAEQQRRTAAEAQLTAPAAAPGNIATSGEPESPPQRVDEEQAALLLERLEAAEQELQRLRAAQAAPKEAARRATLEKWPSVEESDLTLELGEDMERWLVDLPDASQLEACAPSLFPQR